MMRNAFSAVLIVLGVLALVCAAALVGYNMTDDSRAAESVQSVIEQLTPPTTAPTQTDPTVPADSQPVHTVQIPDYVLNPSMDLPAKEIDGRKYVGVLEIPALELNLPILDGWSKAGAKIAPCRYTGTPYMDNMVLCAHNYNSHFGRLNTLKTGDRIYFTDMSGNVFTYEVVSFEVLQPTAVEDMCESHWDLTLFTCTIGGRTRFAVRCERVLS